MSDKNLVEIFQTIRQKNLKEDFEVGQAAQALFELKKTIKEYNEFVNGSFDKLFRELHQSRDGRSDKTHDAVKALEGATKNLVSVVKEVEDYLYNLDTYDNPESSYDGKHRVGRWRRWEHKPTRAQQKAWDKEDDI